MIVTAIVAIFAGILFGLGLSISGMTNPDRVRGFLDVAGGSWDPSLMFVLGGAVSVTVISFRFVFRCAEPTCAPSFELPKKTRVDGPLVLGAAIFGIGWGLSGYCPGPGITGLSYGLLDAVVYVLALIVGSVCCRIVLGRNGCKQAKGE